MTWKDISIAKFQKAQEILTRKRAPIDSYVEMVDKDIELVSLIYGIEHGILLKLPFQKFAELLEGIKFLEDLETIDKRFPKYFTCGGKAFKCMSIGNKMTFGQFVDLDTYAKGDFIANLHNIIAVFCTPLFSKYDGKKHPGYAALFKEKLSMAVAYPIALFFWGAGQRLQPAITSYLDNQATAVLKQATKGVLQNLTGGSSPLTSSQEAWEGTGNSF